MRGEDDDDSDSSEQTILPIELNRRNLLIVAGLGMTSISGFSNTTSAQSDNITRENDLIARWPFEDGFQDVVGNNNASAALGNPETDSYDNAEAVAFDGDDGLRVSRGGNNQLNLMGPDNGAVTFSIWVYFDNTTGGNPFADADTAHHTLIFHDTGYRITAKPAEDSANVYPQFRIAPYGNSSAVEYSTTEDDVNELSTSSWHHLVVVVDSTNFIRIYANGEMIFFDDDMDGQNSAHTEWWSDITIGSWYGGNPEEWANLMKGKISDLRIYNGELSKTEITQIYQNTSRSSENSSGNNTPSGAIFEEHFESYSPDETPTDFVFAGNSDQGVTDSVSQTGDQSYRMSGSHGGCWEAIMRRELFSADERPDAMRIQGSFRLGDGSTGCHSSSAIGWVTVDSSNWSNGSGSSILNFDSDGTITAAGETVGEYNRYEWVDFTVEYEYDTDANEVVQRCTVGNSDPVTVTREEHSSEAALTSLELKSGDYTVYWDDFVIEQIDGVDESPEETGESPDPSISQSSGTTTPDKSVTFDASGSSGTIDSYDWQLGDGTTATGRSVSHTYEQPDTYTVTLTTTSEDGSTATASTEIVVANEEELTFSIQPESPVVGQSVTFEATGGEDYEWNFGDDTTASGQQVTHTYETANTYTVTLSSLSDSISRDLQIQETPITVADISREYGGVPLESITYEDTFQATIESENQLETVEFALGDQSKAATKSGDMWQASFDLGQLDLSDTLTVTATDTGGATKTTQQSVSIAAIPEWMEWLLDVAEISVDESNTRIDIAYDPFNLDSFTFSLGGIPIDVDPPEFDGAPQAEIGYDAGQQAAILDGNGGIESNLFGYGFSAELEVEGKIDTDLDLVSASGEAEASISAQVGPPLYIDIPSSVANLVSCIDERQGIETTVAPGVEIEGEFDGEFDFERGTVTPETLITVGAQLELCGAGIGAEVEGDVEASFDIGTSNSNLSGIVEGSGEAWVDIYSVRATIDITFEVTLPASETQTMEIVDKEPDSTEWTIVNKRGQQPAVEIDTGDSHSISTSSGSTLAPAATTNNSYQRLTDRPLEDTQPTIASGPTETMVIWSGHRENASASAGRDIAYQVETSNGWSDTTYLTTESLSHVAPDAAVSDGAILAAWAYVTIPIDEETEAVDIHSHVEIAYAIYDGESWSDRTVLTASENREFQPTVAPTDDGWIVAWEQSTDPSPGSGQRNVRYTQITADGTAETITDIDNAIYPDTGQYTGSGAVLGYASLVDGEPTETVASRIVDGQTSESQRFDASAVRAVTVGEDRLVWQEGDVSEPVFFEGDRVSGTTTELAVRDEVVATAEPTLATDGEEAVLSYRAYVGDGDTRELVYRLNRGSGWIFDRQFVQAPEATQTVWQPKSAFGAGNDSFTTVFAISNTNRDSKNDIFLTEHDFLP